VFIARAWEAEDISNYKKSRNYTSRKVMKYRTSCFVNHYVFLP